MLDCLVLGDSIAVGVGQARPECSLAAVSGITSEHFVQSLPADRAARTAVISLGVNDGDGIDTLANLRQLRAALTVQSVYWLLPGSNRHAREAIRTVAMQYNDRMIDVAPLAGPDGVHPDRAGYAALAEQTHGADAGLASGGTAPRSAYRDFAPAGDVYRAFPGVTVWNGPYNANGRPVPGSSRP